MTIQQRHTEVNKYFPPGRALNDEEWEKCISDFRKSADQWKGTNLERFAGDVSMAFLDDIERVHKAWIRRGND